jgi:uncharacterized protein with PIN domain/sulfur carrier protein ThiS
MVHATFRFYAGLNDFLERGRRGHELTLPCAENATTKHMIEALGVPHTEVEVILVNGAATNLDALIEDGDRVAVYPRFTQLDVGELVRTPGQPPGRLRFVADAHLGGLARLLRMAGFDTIYRNTIGDEEIEEAAWREQRIVLTRDRELLKRRGIDYGAYVRSLKSQAQLDEIVVRYGLAERARPFTLCLHCNTPLHAVDKQDVLDRLPPMVRATQDEFSACDSCGGVFWKGTHWQRMRAMLDAAGALDIHSEDSTSNDKQRDPGH